jgi:hypothetical protein
MLLIHISEQTQNRGPILDAYYAAFLSFGRGRVAKALRAAAADPTCALAAAHAAHAVAPRDPAGAAAYLAAAADNLVSRELLSCFSDYFPPAPRFVPR